MKIRRTDFTDRTRNFHTIDIYNYWRNGTRMSDVLLQTGRINCHQESRGVFKNNELLAESENFLFFNKISTSLLTWIQVFKAKTLFRVK